MSCLSRRVRSLPRPRVNNLCSNDAFLFRFSVMRVHPGSSSPTGSSVANGVDGSDQARPVSSSPNGGTPTRTRTASNQEELLRKKVIYLLATCCLFCLSVCMHLRLQSHLYDFIRCFIAWQESSRRASIVNPDQNDDRRRRHQCFMLMC